ncbi:hypothetical protein [Roseovarius sp. MBR-6]|jgi:hypothetical protein|uniref:hypothetical protein n=1 Tax=Roseovarius sp. MBR-6 TaxID=3156459 RepID=UPI00339663DC
MWIEDPTFDRHSSSAQRLASAVLNRAILDLFAAISNTGSDAQPGEQDVKENLRFLTDTSGPWAASRKAWCDVVDIDAGEMRLKVLAFLDGDDTLTAHARLFGGNTVSVMQRSVEYTRAAWRNLCAERAAPTPGPIRRPPPPRSRVAVLKETLRDRILESLKGGPRSIREILFDIDGEADTCTIRARLNELMAEGIVERDAPEYRLCKVLPDLAVAACA